MTLKNNLFICVFVLISSCAHNSPKNDVAKEGPKKPSQRSLASNSTEIAKAYFNLAATLSKARSSSGVCESGVYQENIIQALSNARQFEFDNGNFIFEYLNDPNNEESVAIEKEVGNTLSFKLLKSKNMGLGAYQSKTAIEKLLIGTLFESAGVGAYGHTLEYHFQDSAKVIKKQLTNIDSWPLEWSETVGTWESNGHSNKHGGPLVSIKTKYLTGPNKGKNKTEVFVIRQTCQGNGCFYGLVPVNKINKKDYWQSPDWYDFRVFDLKTDECEA